MQQPVLLVDEPTPRPNYSPEGAEGDSPTTSDQERGDLQAARRGSSSCRIRANSTDEKIVPRSAIEHKVFLAKGSCCFFVFFLTKSKITHPRTLISKTVSVLRVLG